MRLPAAASGRYTHRHERGGRGRTLALIGFPLLLVALAVPVVIWRRELWELFSSTAGLREWVSGWGVVAPLVFVAVQALQVVVFVIPGEVPQIAAGYLFGALWARRSPWRASSSARRSSFFLARLLGRPFVSALFPGDRPNGSRSSSPPEALGSCSSFSS